MRELVANGVDAVQKLKKLGTMGLYQGTTDKLQVEVLLDASAKTLTIKDDGLRMTADESKECINQIAFSGAAAFVEKYREQIDQHQLIGFYGLGLSLYGS